MAATSSSTISTATYQLGPPHPHSSYLPQSQPRTAAADLVLPPPGDQTASFISTCRVPARAVRARPRHSRRGSRTCSGITSPRSWRCARFERARCALACLPLLNDIPQLPGRCDAESPIRASPATASAGRLLHLLSPKGKLVTYGVAAAEPIGGNASGTALYRGP